jgi:hypothetical protein
MYHSPVIYIPFLYTRLSLLRPPIVPRNDFPSLPYRRQNEALFEHELEVGQGFLLRLSRITVRMKLDPERSC